MIPFHKESDEVLYPDDDVVLIASGDLDELKRLASKNPRKRIRICGHKSPDDALHEMFIIHTNETYVRPHKHLGKAESFSILEGRVDVVLFHDDGSIRQVVNMGAPDSGLPFYYRLDDPIYHTLLIRTDFLVFHEVTQGPFNREQTIFADWSLSDLDVKEYSTLAPESFIEKMKVTTEKK